MSLLTSDRIKTKNLIIIIGSEAVLRSEALHSFPANDDDEFDRETIIAGERSVLDWIGAACTVPFLAERRTVVVRHLLRAGSPSEAGFDGAIAGSLPPSALLILVADDEPGDDSRQQTLRSRGEAWAKAVQSAGGYVLRCELERGALAGRLREAAQSFGKSISVPALNALIEMCAGSYTRAHDELLKLSLYVGDAPEIRETDVHAAAVANPEWSVYRLIDMMIAGNVGDALEQLRILVGTTSKVEDAAFRLLFPTMLRQLRLIWQARTLLDHGATLSSCTAEVKALLPGKPNLFSERDFVQRKALQAARSIRLVQIARALELMADADAQLKGLKASYSAFETLEQLILHCAATLAQRAEAAGHR